MENWILVLIVALVRYLKKMVIGVIMMEVMIIPTVEGEGGCHAVKMAHRLLVNNVIRMIQPPPFNE
jgi:hypothetical protein